MLSIAVFIIVCLASPASLNIQFNTMLSQHWRKNGLVLDSCFTVIPPITDTITTSHLLSDHIYGAKTKHSEKALGDHHHQGVGHVGLVFIISNFGGTAGKRKQLGPQGKNYERNWLADSRCSLCLGDLFWLSAAVDAMRWRYPIIIYPEF
jgi:hypothetical protein